MKVLITITWLTLASLIFRILLYFLFANEIVASADVIQMSILGRKFADGNYFGVLNTYWTPVYPFFLGIFTLFTKSVVQSAVIISIIASALIVPLTFYLVKQSYGRQVALIAGILAIFLPHFINSMFNIGTENLYLLWITGSLILGWRAFKYDKLKDYLFVGILLGISYLTRPEAFGYLFLFVLVIFCKRFFEKQSVIGLIPAKQLISLSFGFFLFASPYMFYLKSETGIWTISGKIQANTIVGDFEANENSSNTENIENEKLSFKSFTKYFILNLMQIQKSLSYLVPSFLFIIIGLGLFARRWNKRRFLRETYLIFFCILTILGYAAAVVQDRYLFILLPIFLGWISFGIVHLTIWFRNSIQNLQNNSFFLFLTQKAAISIILILVYAYIFPINFFVRTKEKAWAETAYEERDAGLWLKNNSNPSSLVFSAVLRPVFYSENRHLPLTTNTIDDTIKNIKEKNVEFIITSDRSLVRNPSLKGLTEVLLNSPEFELVYERKDFTDYKISIFKVN